jgi:hypothetical protein
MLEHCDCLPFFNRPSQLTYRGQNQISCSFIKQPLIALSPWNNENAEKTDVATTTFLNPAA